MTTGEWLSEKTVPNQTHGRQIHLPWHRAKQETSCALDSSCNRLLQIPPVSLSLTKQFSFQARHLEEAVKVFPQDNGAEIRDRMGRPEGKKMALNDKIVWKRVLQMYRNASLLVNKDQHMPVA